jgi:hypothetical protein
MEPSFGHRRLWRYSHNASIFTAVLVFAADSLGVLLWTNHIDHTPSSTADTSMSTFARFSLTVSTFNITYNVVSKAAGLSPV